MRFKEKNNLDNAAGIEKKVEDIDKRADDIQKEITSLRESQHNLIRAKDNILHEISVIEDRIKKYEDKSDPLEKFMKEFVEEDAEGKIWKFEFEKKLNGWCSTNRFRQFSEIVIGTKMKEKGQQDIMVTEKIIMNDNDE